MKTLAITVVVGAVIGAAMFAAFVWYASAFID